MEAMEYILLAGLVLTLLLQAWLLLLFLRRPWRKDAVRIADRQTEEWKEELREQRQVTAEEFWRMEQRIDGLGERQMRLQTDLLRGQKEEQTLTEAQYAKNVAIKNNGERVEYAVRVPSRDQEGAWIWLPIDSKFPQEDYLRLADAAERVDKAGVEEAGRALERSIRKSAETIARLYIDVPNTTDFAILFLPTEGLYAEVLRRPGLTEEIQRKYRVMICGPATVTAFLNTLRVGFRTIALDRQASQVWKLLEATKAQYEQFGRQLEKAQKKIEEAGHAVGEAQKRSGLIQRKLKDVDTLEAPEAERVLGMEGTEEGIL